MKTNIMQNHATDQDSLWIDMFGKMRHKAVVKVMCMYQLSTLYTTPLPKDAHYSLILMTFYEYGVVATFFCALGVKISLAIYNQEWLS